MNVFFLHLARDLRHGEQWVSLFYHDLGLDLVGLIGNFWLVEQLLPSGCRATSERNSFIQSCFKKVFGGGRGDAYTFSKMTCPVSIRTTFGKQQAGRVS